MYGDHFKSLNLLSTVNPYFTMVPLVSPNFDLKTEKYELTSMGHVHLPSAKIFDFLTPPLSAF